MPVYTERKLISPFLFLVYKYPGIKMEKIIPMMIEAMKPSDKDALKATGRNDTYFSQKVRNLKSHRSSNKMDLYTNIDNEGRYTITEAGMKILEQDYDAMNALFSYNISESDELKRLTSTSVTKCVKKVRVFKEDELINEGTRIIKNVMVLKRSKKLRDFAMQRQLEKKDFKCAICGFDFKEKYGEIGKAFIQFHHIVPLSEYVEEELDDKKLKDALQNIIPICPNCHCMIHKLNGNDTVNQLKEIINGGKN